MAEKDGKVKFFKNGLTAAKELKCSHVLVYKVANGTASCSTAKGWTLKWVDKAI